MKKNLHSAYLFILLFTSPVLFAQVTKLSNNTGLSGYNINGRVIMSGDNDDKLWTTNGTAAGTVIYTTKVTVDTTENGGGGAILNNKLYFAGVTTTNGSELWVTDGTDAGTSLVKDINPGAAGSSATDFFTYNGVIYFFADNGSQGSELWKTDGTAGGTVLVKDINSGAGSSVSENVVFYAYNGNVYFNAFTPAAGIELYKTNGTAAGTVMIKDINPGVGSSLDGNQSLKGFAGLGNFIYFSADNGVDGFELWKSDGTTGGTVMVKNISTDVNFPSSKPDGFTVCNNKLFFTTGYSTVEDQSNLWETDGTTAGTKNVKTKTDAADYPQIAILYEASVINNKLIFPAISPKSGYELWVTDGSVANTNVLKDINTAGSSTPAPLLSFQNFSSQQLTLTTIYKGKVYFAATDASLKRGIWATDGTAAGTTLIKNLYTGNLGMDSSYFPSAYFAQNAIYFSSRKQDATSTIEIWKTDGSANGTSELYSMATNPDNGSPLAFDFVYNSQLYFTADDNDNSEYLTDLYKLNENTTTLPITLLNLTGSVEKAGVQLDWVTASEINSSHFILQRSADGLTFKDIATVAAAGNSNNQRQYNYNDADAFNQHTDVLFYKLQMFDKDGQYKFSEVATIKLKDIAAEIKFSPNPVKNLLTVSLKTGSASKVNLRITDASGKTVYLRTNNSPQSSFVQSINVEGLTRGLYFLQVVTDKQSKTISFIKD